MFSIVGFVVFGVFCFAVGTLYGQVFSAYVKKDVAAVFGHVYASLHNRMEALEGKAESDVKAEVAAVEEKL